MGHESVPWRLGGPAEFDEELLASFQAKPQGNGTELVSWTCPYCKYEHVETVERDVDIASLDLADRPLGELPLRCECGLDHEGRPAGEAGCGYQRVLILGVDE